MTRPIAKAANVTARSRRRQGSPVLLRAALILALAAVCAMATPVFLAAARSGLAPHIGPSGPAQAAASQLPMSGLQTGACMSLEPSSAGAGKAVFLDPGHGGLDPGVVGLAGGRQVLEKDVTLAVASRLATRLQTAVVRAMGTSDRGVWTDDQLAAPTLTAAGSLYGHLIELGPAATGWVDSPSKMPGALVEPLFLTNPAEARVASDPAGQQRIAVALRAGLAKYFSGA